MYNANMADLKKFVLYFTNFHILILFFKRLPLNDIKNDIVLKYSYQLSLKFMSFIIRKIV